MPELIVLPEQRQKKYVLPDITMGKQDNRLVQSVRLVHTAREREIRKQRFVRRGHIVRQEQLHRHCVPPENTIRIQAERQARLVQSVRPVHTARGREIRKQRFVQRGHIVRQEQLHRHCVPPENTIRIQAERQARLVKHVRPVPIVRQREQ